MLEADMLQWRKGVRERSRSSRVHLEPERSVTEDVCSTGRPSCEIAVVVCGGGYRVERLKAPRRQSIGELQAHKSPHQIKSMILLLSHDLVKTDLCGKKMVSLEERAKFQWRWFR